jgi:hypothetical protein
MKRNIKAITEYISTIGRRKGDDLEFNSQEKLNQLRKHGFVILDHLVGSSELARIKNLITQKIETDLDLEFPCLSQNKIDLERNQALIEKKFLATNKQLESLGLTFSRDDLQSYQQMLDEFKPATLTVPMPSDEDFFNLWLDPIVISIVSSYMGFVPHLNEAYTRRNFPSDFNVMNFNWHRDTNHEKYLLKAFFFFTDCNIKTGAHHYIAGSIHDPRFRDKVYYTDNEINVVWPIGSADHMISTVPAGTIIIEDTRGLHKAGIPSEAYRDLGFAIFTPPNIFRKSKSFYKITNSVYNALSSDQKRFIPPSNIKNG